MSRQDVSEEETTKIIKEAITELGYSEHHISLAVDVVDQNWYNSYPSTVPDASYEDRPGAKWIADNVAQYGLIVRYPKGYEDITKITYEPWHLRCVGKENIKYITRHQLTLEEYLSELNEKQESIMAKKKWRKQKRRNTRWPVAVAGVAVILLTFVFSSKNLSSPFTDNQQENEAQSHQQSIEQPVPYAQEL